MLKISIGLAIIAILLLLLSAIPRPLAAPVATAEPTPAPMVTPDLVAEGRALFKAKGCVTCHRHDAVVEARPDSLESSIQGDSSAPNLTEYQPNPDFVRIWLKDPAAVRPNTRMPALELKEGEIEALIAFLASP